MMSARSATADRTASVEITTLAARSAMRGDTCRQLTRTVLIETARTGSVCPSRQQRGRIVLEQLGEHIELVEQHPVLDDQAVPEVELLEPPDVHPATGRFAVQRPTAMGPERAPADRYSIPLVVITHPVDLIDVQTEVRERRQQAAGHRPDV